MKRDLVTCWRNEDDSSCDVAGRPLGTSLVECVPHPMDAAALSRGIVARSVPNEAQPVDLDDVNDARSLAVLSVPRHSRVLLVAGSRPGAVVRALVSRGCQVWAIDSGAVATQLAEPRSDGLLLGDVETADLDGLLGAQRADAIVFLDVLEHLRDPAGAIRRVVPLLAAGGKIVLSVPHVAHAAMRLQLLTGAFPRTSEGLLDRTHLHFFDRSSLHELLRHANVSVIDEARVVRSLEEIESPQNLAAFPREAIDLATTGPDADTCQFVLTVTPGTDGASVERMPTLVSTLTKHLHRVERNNRRLLEHATELETQIAKYQLQDDALREALDEAREGHRRAAEAVAALREDLQRSDLRRQQSEEQLAGTTNELVRCQLERRFLRDDVLVKDAYVATLRQQATTLRHSHAESQAAERRQSQADLLVLTERLDALATAHAAEVKRGTDLALSNCDIRQQLERARQELDGVHASVATTLAQTRYVVADHCNAWMRKAGFLHAALKQVWAAWRRGQ